MQKVLVILFIFLPGFVFGQSLSPEIAQDLIVVKIKETNSTSNKSRTTAFSPEEFLQIDGIKGFEKPFNRNKNGNARIVENPFLSRFIYLRTDGNHDIRKLINKLNSMENIEYAEPFYLMKPLYTPDDPDAAPGTGKLTYLKTINAYQAWSHEQGNNNVYVGVLDTGYDPEHSDLQKNIYINYNDPVNGIDDDGDGLVDNYKGYDFANDDNDPTADKSGHGTSVTAVGFSDTDNGVGFAGVGFNTKFVPYKIFTSEGNFFYRGYEAMVFAAENGCKVLNLSWGAPNARSKYVEELIDYIVLELDVVVVAAAGNTHGEFDFYPASYNNVLSVGSTNYNDEKADFASYSPFIDIMAPGKSIYITSNNERKFYSQGSSLSTPMVSATAALIRARYPDLSALQVMERIRVTADNIENIGKNNDYNGKLGSGRLNIGRALLDYTTPSLRMIDFNYYSKLGKFAFFGDSLSIEISVSNLLSASSNAKAILRSESPFVTIVDSVFEIGNLNINQWKSNNASPFKIYIDENTPANQQLRFSIHFTDLDYSADQTFDIFTENSYLEISGKNLQMTVGSSGNLAFDADSLQRGIGLKYNEQLLARSLGVFYFSQSDTADNSFINHLTPEHNKDFISLKPIKFTKRNGVQYPELIGRFEKPGSKILVEEHLIADNSDGDFIIIEYNIYNRSNSAIEQLYFSLLADYAIGNDSLNRFFTDDSSFLGYSTSQDSEMISGIGIINTNEKFISVGLDLNNFNSNQTDIPNPISISQKADLLINSDKKVAGQEGNGNDVGGFTGLLIDKIDPDSLKKVVFVITAGNTINDLKNNIDKAKSAYQKIIDNPVIEQNYTICKGEDINISPGNGTFQFYSDPRGNSIIYSGETLSLINVNQDTVIYYRGYSEADLGILKGISINIDETNAEFNISESPLFLSESSDSAAVFTPVNLNSISYSWDFGNGIMSSNNIPRIKFTEEGTFNIELSIVSKFGCFSSISKNLNVINRPRKPIIQQDFFEVCKGDSLHITFESNETLYFFSDGYMNNLLDSGYNFTLNKISSDTSIFVSGKENEIFTEPTEIIISIIKPDATFSIFHDLDSERSLIFKPNFDEHKNYTWYFQGDLLSNESITYYELTNNETNTVTLSVTDSLGCSNSETQIITPKPFPVTIPNTIYSCTNSQITIDSPEDYIYLFYSDKELSNLIYKGDQFTINNPELLDSLYIVNYTGYYFGNSKAVKIDIIPNEEPVILSSTDSLNLEIENNIQLWAENQFYETYNWTLPGGASYEGDSVDFYINNTGNYTFSLIATDQFGCTHQNFKTIVAMNEPIITGIEGNDLAQISVYPSPAQDNLLIRNYHKISKWSIYNANGRLFSSGNEGQADLRLLTPGVYYFVYFDNSGNKKALPFIKE
ncbi:S8 family serine peptidase [Marinigracilibium pacificum]|uniref:S8 family serine peptidase n=1 Tax=Marinigracilibium pacificum TaxID=2729599 RepID=A0A848J3B8_9BACT|nr:S8 family serine peptidase [Marinigracilibium pacificum]NMM50221.1 S8 family serine peptidase [Marinigracilibium pacificum]